MAVGTTMYILPCTKNLRRSTARLPDKMTCFCNARLTFRKLYFMEYFQSLWLKTDEFRIGAGPSGVVTYERPTALLRRVKSKFEAFTEWSRQVFAAVLVSCVCTAYHEQLWLMLGLLQLSSSIPLWSTTSLLKAVQMAHANCIFQRNWILVWQPAQQK